jgi:HlyD family secretion protein
VNVTLGQEVKQGDVLAEIEPDEDLGSALISAEVNLDSAQAKLDELLESPTESDLASADQSLLQAQTNYDQAESALEDLLDGSSESDLLSAELAVASAESQLANAEKSRADLYSDAEEAVTKAEQALADAKRTADSAADSLVTAEASLQSAAEDYCDTDDHVFEICEEFSEEFSIPLSKYQINKLSDSLDPEEDPESDLISATSSLISANSSYKNALASKSSADADVVSAEEDLEEAKKGPSSAEILSADVAVAEAQLSLDEAKEELAELIEGPTQEDLEEAQSELDQAAAALVVAQLSWSDVYDGSDPLDIELQQEEVRQAELSVEQARQDLEKAQVIAPFDGTVAELNIELNQEVSSQETAIVLNTPDALRLDLTISESDLPNVEVGQSGFATFDALGDISFPFVIDSLGTSPTTTQGVVTYEARATLQTERSAEAMGARFGAQGGDVSGQADIPEEVLEQFASGQADIPDTEAIPEEALEQFAASVDTDTKPLPGMNASVTITVAQAQDVLLVAIQAVQTEGFQSVVEVLNDDGSTETVVVQTGLSDEMNIEITEGLEEGQTIIIPTRVATSTETTTSTEFPQGGFIITEGGAPGGGMREQGSAP